MPSKQVKVGIPKRGIGKMACTDATLKGKTLVFCFESDREADWFKEVLNAK